MSPIFPCLNLVALMYSCGLRRSEVVNLDLSDYDPSTNELIVNGKRNKQRMAYLVNGATQAVGDWLTIRGKRAGPLFTPINTGRNGETRCASQEETRHRT